MAPLESRSHQAPSWQIHTLHLQANIAHFHASLLYCVLVCSKKASVISNRFQATLRKELQISKLPNSNWTPNSELLVHKLCISHLKQQHRSLCQILEKEGHAVKLYPIILGTQGSIFNCFKAAMSAVGVQGPQQMALARKLHDHAVTSLSKIIRPRRLLEHQVLKCKTKKPADRH